MSIARVHSDLPLRVDRPFFVAACVRSASNAPTQVTFYLKDLSNDDEPVFNAQADGPGVGAWGRFDRLSLGGRMGDGGGWDGMLDDVRLSAGVLGPHQLLLSGQESEEATALGFWRFEARPGYFRDHSKLGNDLEPGRKASGPPMNVETLALADLCHALLNSSEFLYVE